MAKLMQTTTSNASGKRRPGAGSRRRRRRTAGARSGKAHGRRVGSTAVPGRALEAKPRGLDCVRGWQEAAAGCGAGEGPARPGRLPLLAAAPPAGSPRGAGSGCLALGHPGGPCSHRGRLHLPILTTSWGLPSRAASAGASSSSSCVRIVGGTLSLGGPAGWGSEAARGLLSTSKSPSSSSRAPSPAWPGASLPRPLPGGGPAPPGPDGGVSSAETAPWRPPSGPESV